jgi:hypothetical protein
MNKHSFEKLEEKLGNEKKMISKAQLASAISDVVTTTLVATVPIGTSIQACAIAAAETKRVLDDFFLAGEPEKKTEDVPDTEKDSKFEDLKNRIFYCSAECGVPIPGTDIENNRTAEIRRDAKHAALISLILNAGLGGEYREWLRKRYE